MVTRNPAPTFSFSSKDDLFTKRIDQVDNWLLAIDLMKREATILEYGLEICFIEMDDRIDQADTYGPMALGVNISRACWKVLTHEQKREQIATNEERTLFRPPITLAHFYRAMVLYKPRLLFMKGLLEDQTHSPTLKLWEERHEYPSGVYTGQI